MLNKQHIHVKEIYKFSSNVHLINRQQQLLQTARWIAQQTLKSDVKIIRSENGMSQYSAKFLGLVQLHELLLILTADEKTLY